MKGEEGVTSLVPPLSSSSLLSSSLFSSFPLVRTGQGGEEEDENEIRGRKIRTKEKRRPGTRAGEKEGEEGGGKRKGKNIKPERSCKKT